MAMKPSCIALAMAAATVVSLPSQTANDPFAGRWDITVRAANATYPSWMEVAETNGRLEVRVQGRTGNVHPAAAARREGPRLVVTVAPAMPARPAEGERPAMRARPELTWAFTADGARLKGTQKQGEREAQLTAARAPALKRAAPAAWTAPEPLFNGKDLTGWEPINNTSDGVSPGANNFWTAKNGELVNEGKGANLRTTRTFEDFKLHIEYNCPPNENSGVYLRGRYEAQVAPPPRREVRSPRAPRPGGGGMPALFRNPHGGVGSIYGFLGPSEPPAFRPEWQTYDLTLIGRWVTVVFNGVTLIDNQEIAGITGGALDSNEAEPGPIYLQGDHHGGIRYRNITISVPRR
jgi:hypothetical protein